MGEHRSAQLNGASAGARKQLFPAGADSPFHTGVESVMSTGKKSLLRTVRRVHGSRREPGRRDVLVRQSRQELDACDVRRPDRARDRTESVQRCAGGWHRLAPHSASANALQQLRERDAGGFGGLRQQAWSPSSPGVSSPREPRRCRWGRAGNRRGCRRRASARCARAGRTAASPGLPRRAGRPGRSRAHRRPDTWPDSRRFRRQK